MDFLEVSGDYAAYALVRMEPEMVDVLTAVGADSEDCEEDDWPEDDACS